MFSLFLAADFAGTEVDEDNIDGTKNSGDIDSIINNVISCVFAAFSSLPASPDVKRAWCIDVDTEDVISDVDATTKFVNVDSTICVVEKYCKSLKVWRTSDLKCLESIKAHDTAHHLDIIFYYMRKKVKYEPNIAVKFTTTNFIFRNKIDDLYQDFVKNGKIFLSSLRNTRLRSISEASIVMQMYHGTRAFVCAFTEYFIHGRDIPKEIDIGYVRNEVGFLPVTFVAKIFLRTNENNS
ncbi:hypothetical protein FXO37_20856 [Capsicum annuum]|nr:hypothetical protein FXO37_20856 [Capsicum annuum]